MGLAQMFALTGGKRYKRPYVQEINARSRYLPQVYAQKKADEYRDKMYGLEQQRLGMSQEALDEQKKMAKRAQLYGYANLGVGTGLGLAGLASDKGWFDIFGSGGDAAYEPVKGLASDFSSMASPFTGENSMSYLDDAYDFGGSFLKNFSSGGGGGIFDSIFGDAIDFGDLSDFMGF